MLSARLGAQSSQRPVISAPRCLGAQSYERHASRARSRAAAHFLVLFTAAHSLGARLVSV